MEKRRMCSNCRAFITTSDRVCPFCNEPVMARAVDMRNPGSLLGGLIPAARVTTSIILMINIGVYLATMYGGQNGRLLVLLGEKDSQAILVRHEWWRLITAGFLHGGLLHIGMNMWVLNDLGAEVEKTYGTSRFLVVYFAGTVCGFFMSSIFSLNPSVGASAGLFGLIGAMIAFGMRNRTTVGRQIRSFYIRWAIYGIMLGLLPGFRIDNFAHLGGLVAGIAVAYVAGTPAHAGRFAERLWQAMAVLCLALTAYSFWLIFSLFMQYRDMVPAGA